MGAAADAGLPVTPAAGDPLAPGAGFAPDREVLWAVRTLFGTPGNDGDQIVRRARTAMLVVAVALGAVAAGWAYRLAGGVAALVAVALFAFDPTVLAQAPLVKSDVAFGLAYVGLGWLAWAAGRRLTVGRAVGLGLVCGAAANVKFTGLLTGPVLAGLLAARTVGPTPWPAFGRVVRTRAGRLAAAAAAGSVAAAVAVAVTWACYGFRYRPAPDPAATIDMPAVYAAADRAAADVAVGRPATAAEVAARGPTALVRIVRWVDVNRLLPQAYSAGVVHQSGYVAHWPGYLDGVVYADGRVSYFPLAAAYKTPVAELAAFMLAAVVGLRAAVRKAGRRRGAGAEHSGLRPAAKRGFARTGSLRLRSFAGERAWAVACLLGPAAAFAVAAAGTHLNVGLRTVLPLYAYADVGAGVAAAWAWRRRPRATAAVAATALSAMAVTAVAAWPDYIPFFNAVVGGPRAGLAHLADSNLDWGQDVRGLADWQWAHPGTPVYADLFLSVDPAFYGLRVNWLWVPDAAGRPTLNRPDRPP